MIVRINTLFLLIILSSALHAEVVVTYPKARSAQDVRSNDLIELLTLSLEVTKETHGAYKLQASGDFMNEKRQRVELSKGERLNIMWSSTSTALEESLLPIRIPLRKGLLGYRISLINKNNQDNIDRVKTLNDLRGLTIGQGHGWGDSAIYESNGIKVKEADYDSLFKMVVQNRFDLFPRGINEVFDEYRERAVKAPSLAIEENLLIVYLWPYYFFTNKKDWVLADRIETGLKKIIGLM